MILGFAVALVIGGGAGAAIGPMAQSMAAPKAADSQLPNLDLGRVDVETVAGTVQMQDAKGDWVNIEPGDRLTRPLAIRTVGAEGRVGLAFKGIRLVGEHGTHFMLSAPGMESSVLLQSGHLRVYRGSGDLALYIPDREVKLLGQTFGVWVREKGVAVAVLDGELEVKAPGRKPMKFARGRELVLAKRVVPAVLDQKLEVQVQGTSRRGYRYTLTARTAPHAHVVHTDDKGNQKVLQVSPAGVFSVDLLDRRPQPGQLVAYDSAGRRAEVDKPSISLSEVVEALSGAAPAKAEAAQPAEPAKAPAESPPPAETSPAKAAPEPAKAAPAKKRTVKAKPKAKGPSKASTRGERPPEPVRLEIGKTKRPPALDVTKTEVDPRSGKQKAAPVSKPKPKPAPKEPEAGEEAL